MWSIVLILIMGAIGIASVLESPSGNNNNKKRKIDHVLVFGHDKIADELKKMGFEVDYVSTSPDISQLNVYDSVLALSDDDMENMRLCVTAAHLDSSTVTVIRCVDQVYMAALKDANVGFIVSRDVTASELKKIIRKKK